MTKAYTFVGINKLIKKLNNNIDYLQHGGCGVLTAELYEFISRYYKGVRIKIADEDHIVGKTSIKKARMKKKGSAYTDWNAVGVEFGHILLEFVYRNRVYVMDSDGIRNVDTAYEEDRLTPYEDSLTIEELKILTSTHKGWNPWFNRDSIPMLQVMICEHFDYKRSGV